MSEIEKAIKHFENMRDENFVVLTEFKKDLESGNSNGSTLLYDNRHTYYSLAIKALRAEQEREKGCEYCNAIRETNSSGRVFYKDFPDEYEIGKGTACLAWDKSGWKIHWEEMDEYEIMYGMKVKACPHCGRILEEKNYADVVVCDYSLKLLKAMPTADVQEIVRCKDCIYHHIEEYGEEWCGKFDGGIGTFGEDYCSHGVREKMDGDYK